MHTTSGPFPVWLRILVGVFALILVIFMLALGIFFPEGWTSFLSMPIAVARLVFVAIMVVGLGVAGVVIANPQREMLYRLVDRLYRVRSHPVSLVLVVIPVSIGLIYIVKEWWGQVVLGLAMLTLALLIYQLGHERQKGIEARLVKLLPPILIAGGILLRIWYLIGGDFYDEPYYLSLVANVVQGGPPIPAMIAPPPSLTFYPMWGRLVAVYGLWGKLFGVGLIQMRVLGLVIGLLALPLIYGIAKMWYGERAARYTVALVMVSYLGMHIAHGRNNSLPTVAYSGVLFLHLFASQKERPILHFLVGLAAMLALETHLMLLVAAFAIGGYYAIDSLRHLKRSASDFVRAPLWFFAAGCVVGGLIYVATHILTLEDPAAFLNYLGGIGSKSGFWGDQLQRVNETLTRYTFWGWDSWVEMVIVGLSMTAALIRRTHSDRHWLILVALNEVGYLFLDPLHMTVPSYTSFALPLLFAGSGALFTEGFGRVTERSRSWLQTGLLASWLLMLTCTVYTSLESHAHRRWLVEIYREPTTFINEHLPQDAVIVGPDYFFMFVPDREYYLPPGFLDTGLGPALTKRTMDDYWLDVFLRTWPQANVYDPWSGRQESIDPSSLHGSYFVARGVWQPVTRLWVVPDEELVITAQAGDTAPIQMVGWTMPARIPDDSEIQIRTIWVTRTRLEEGTNLAADLQWSNETWLPLGGALLVDHYTQQAGDEWTPYRFHAVMITLPKSFFSDVQHAALQLDITGTDQCEPDCSVTIEFGDE